MKARIRRSADGQAYLVIPKANGPSVVITNKTKNQMEAISLPTSITNAIRARKGPVFIEIYREDTDLAVWVMIEGYTLAFCSPEKAQRLLIRRPREIFTA